MLKKTITYTDFNGVSRTEDFFFNLTKAEIAEMEFTTVGGFGEMIQRLVSTQDIPSLCKLIKDFILLSYGEKSADGKRFVKSKELSDGFSQTEAYSQLFMEVATDDVAAVKFINGIMPSDMQQDPHKLIAMAKTGDFSVVNNSETADNN